MSGEINVISRTQIIVVEPITGSIAVINAGPPGLQGPEGPRGADSVVPGPQGPAGSTGPTHVPLLPASGAASAAATNLAATTWNAVSDPSYRTMVDLNGLTKVRLMGRIGGSLVAATKIRVQYHTGGDPNVATGDGGWTTLCTSAGSHTLNALFYTAEISVPAGARIANCLIRAGLYDGDGVADPTLTCCVLNFYA